MQWIADPLADEAVAAILGPWTAPAAGGLANSPAEATRDAVTGTRLQRVADLNAVIRTWTDNASVLEWQPDDRAIALGIAEPLRRYLAAARPLPAWAQASRIANAEKMFTDYGPLAVTLLFCASLPECYVVPDLAAVLHATGQLDQRAEHRVRATGAMIFPVLMAGGLTQPEGAGVAQILKVRLIHATVRNLILRGSPQEAAAQRAGAIAPLAGIRASDPMHHALHVHGWDLDACALPNNQEELAYPLLTFSYVFLRGMRRLNNGFTRDQEEDFIHAWNVAGHFIGIRRELMVDTMDEAEALFARMQERGRAEWARRPHRADPRPRLGAALMAAMETVLSRQPWKSLPVLATRHLIEPASAHDLGLEGRVPLSGRALFAILLWTAHGVDAVARLAFPRFSIARMLTRLLGYRLTCLMLMNQTDELTVPAHLRPGIRATIRRWSHDSTASRLMNAVEDYFTTRGDWEPLERPDSK